MDPLETLKLRSLEPHMLLEDDQTKWNVEISMLSNEVSSSCH